MSAGNVGVIGRRTIAMGWVIDPDLFGGLSQTEIAAIIGCHKMNLSKSAAEFSRKFKIRNRGQRHGWNYNEEVISRAAKFEAAPIPTENGVHDEGEPDGA